MSAVGELAGYLVEYGGPLHTHAGWIARDASGRLVDGYRYAYSVECGRPDCAGAVCDGCAFVYVGRAFAESDAVAVLADIVAHAVWTPDGRAGSPGWRWAS